MADKKEEKPKDKPKSHGAFPEQSSSVPPPGPQPPPQQQVPVSEPQKPAEPSKKS